MIRVIGSLILGLIGIFSLLTIQMPSKTGIIGVHYYRSVLVPFFGHAALLFGIALISGAGIVLFSRKPMQRLAGLVLVLMPLLIWIDDAFVTDLFPARSMINRFSEFAFIRYIGNAGLIVLELLLMAAGVILLLKQSRMQGYLRSRVLSTKQSRSEEESTEDEAASTEEEAESEAFSTVKPVKAKPVKEKPISLAEGEAATDTLELNLKPYRKSFNKPQLSDFKKQPADSVSYGEKKDKIKEVFGSLGVEVEMGGVIGGPSVEQYEITPGKGVKLSQIKKLEDDLSLALKSKVLITFNTQGSLCVEAPMAKRRTVYFRRLLESAGEIKAQLPVILGVNTSYETYSFDLAELPHLLIAGTTGSGKSILVKTILASIMFKLTPNDVRLVLVDPKRVDFGIFNASPFMAYKVITDIELASVALRTLVAEMEYRYDILERSNASNIATYNRAARPGRQLPYIVAVIDEFADLIMVNKSDIGDNIIRIAQKARACGIHLILATQRPSAEVISGLIKANVPGKIALSVSSSINSKIIIDRTGAEKLLGKGDMIFISPDIKDGIRLQGAFISDEEIRKFMN